MSVLIGDPSELLQKLESSSDPLLLEAAARIRHLEGLCGMMTDTGVLLEEDVRELVKADTWWLPNDSEYCYDNLLTGMADIAQSGTVVEWARAHTLDNSYAVWFEEIRNSAGAVIYPEGVREFDSYEEAEEAAPDYILRRKRAEYKL